jgi:hypothetical protein
MPLDVHRKARLVFLGLLGAAGVGGCVRAGDKIPQ